jgi:hypothetical protein
MVRLGPGARARIGFERDPEAACRRVGMAGQGVKASELVDQAAVLRVVGQALRGDRDRTLVVAGVIGRLRGTAIARS